MTTTERLANILKGMGYSRIELYYPTGSWKRADTVRWHGYMKRADGGRVSICCWSTMTDCIRKGFTVDRCADIGAAGELEAFINEG